MTAGDFSFWVYVILLLILLFNKLKVKKTAVFAVHRFDIDLIVLIGLDPFFTLFGFCAQLDREHGQFVVQSIKPTGLIRF